MSRLESCHVLEARYSRLHSIHRVQRSRPGRSIHPRTRWGRFQLKCSIHPRTVLEVHWWRERRHPTRSRSQRMDEQGLYTVSFRLAHD